VSASSGDDTPIGVITHRQLAAADRSSLAACRSAISQSVIGASAGFTAMTPQLHSSVHSIEWPDTAESDLSAAFDC
jgi:hypothetical protein